MQGDNNRVNLYKELLSRKPVAVEVDNSFYADNRARLLKRFRETVPEMVKQGVIVVGSKSTQHLHDTDVKVRVQQAFNFTYLFGSDESDIIGVINIEDGRTAIFYPDTRDTYDEIHKPEGYYAELFDADIDSTLENFADVLTKKFNAKTIFFSYGIDSDSGLPSIIPEVPDIEKFEVDKLTLYPIICESRVRKSDKELDLLRFAARVSSEGHIAVMQNAKPGVMEYQVEAVFRLQCHILAGTKDLSYEGICAGGRAPSTLHYIDNNKLVKDGDLMLVDMGCTINGYVSDITTGFPVNGKFTKHQKEIYDAVLDANNTVKATMKPGVNWEDMHLLAEQVILKHLTKLGLVKEAPWEELHEHRIGAIFMPHGLGHFIGVSVHDVGGYLPNFPPRIQKAGLKSLRFRRKLEKGMALTTEPGIYFIDYALEQAYNNPDQAKYLNKEKIDEYYHVGGVRIEDDVCITEDGIENFTVVPRTTEEIEKCMSGLDWRF